jgi:hypothetical protein
MLWIGTALTLVAGVVVLMMALFAKCPADLEDLGSVSAHWVVSHQVEGR